MGGIVGQQRMTLRTSMLDRHQAIRAAAGLTHTIHETLPTDIIDCWPVDLGPIT